MAANLQFGQTTKRFGSQLALDGLSLSVEPGEIFGFLGPNGAGKTTAIHLALGFLRATSGGGKLLGRPFGEVAARAHIGFLSDAPAFFTGNALTAMELAGRLNDVRSPELRTRARVLLQQFALPHSSNRAAKEARKFSRGMQQRLGLAQALVNDPDLLILDEPTSALDPHGVLELREVLRAARDQGKSIFFSSHQLSEVEQICDRVAFLHRGRLVRQGPLHELLKSGEEVEIVVRGLPAGAEMIPGVKKHVQSGEFVRITVPVNMQRETIERTWLAGGELVSVTPLHRSLEELFITLSGETDGASG